MGLVAARAAGRMQARQNYRTMARMQRRRSFVQDKMGMKEDFSSGEQPAQMTATAPAAPEPEYVGELERLAPSCGTRASSATRSLKLRRSRSSVSETGARATRNSSRATAPY